MDRLLAISLLLLGIAGDPVRAPRPAPEKCLDCRLVGPAPSRTPSGGPELLETQQIPEPLPQAGEVVPLPSTGLERFAPEATAKRDPAIEALVEKQLPNLTDAEQSIWIEELSGLPVGIAREMLLARERAGGGLALETERSLDPGQPAEAAQRRFLEQEERRKSELPRAKHIAALQRSLDILRQAEAVILNNIANANTIGFKRRIPFTSAAAYGLAGLATGRTTIQGPLVETGRPLDLALRGPGFFQVERSGTIALTRAGRFHVSKEGTIATTIDGQEWLLYPRIDIPAGSTELAISPDGTVQARTSSGKPIVTSGRIQLVLVADRSQLKRIAPGLWSIPNGVPTQTGNPGQPGFASIRDGYLENSNVDLSRALKALKDIRRQREALSSAVESQSRGGRKDIR